MTTDHLNDALAGVAFLRNAPRVDSKRIVSAGHSFGGQVAVLVAERDRDIRGVVAFAAAAQAWEGSPERRQRMLAATRAVNAPVLLLYAQNDYSVVPGKDMSAELTRLNKPNELKIYPPVGSSTADGHRAVYGAVEVWEKDVFAFLDQHVR